MSSQPNAFIVGAPKCGTTSLASWLAQHPDVLVSTPKEPHYWSQDIRTPHRVSAARYASLFHSGKEARVRLDASTLYLYSRVAVGAILEQIPQARFIVCTRDPVDMALSLYRHQRRIGFESASSLEEAWALQEARLRGEVSIPSACPDPQVLQYGPMCRLGEQLHRLLEQVPADRVLVLCLEDLASKPAAAYAQVLSFLEVPSDGRVEFPAENEGGEPRSRLLQRLLGLASRLKFLLGINRSFGLARRNRVVVRMDKSALEAATRDMLTDYFREDQALLARVLTESGLAPSLHMSKRA